jgi:hypothetical protein
MSAGARRPNQSSMMNLLIAKAVCQLAASIRSHQTRLTVLEPQDVANFVSHNPGIAETDTGNAIEVWRPGQVCFRGAPVCMYSAPATN